MNVWGKQGEKQLSTWFYRLDNQVWEGGIYIENEVGPHGPKQGMLEDIGENRMGMSLMNGGKGR